MQAYDSEHLTRIKSVARALGTSHSLVSKPDNSARAFNEIRRTVSAVRESHRLLALKVEKVRHVTFEIESIFDNFFVVESAIYGLESGLQGKDARKLPLIVSRDGKEELRLYYILRALAEETNGVFDRDTLITFLSEYQEISPLSIRELYAITPMLQAVLALRFGDLIRHAARSLDEYAEADRVYALVKKELTSPKYGFPKLASMLAARYSIAPIGFGLALLERLSAEGSLVRPIVRWIKLNFEKQGIDSKRLTDLLSEERNSNSLRAANIVQSLHWLTQTRWEGIVREVNVVDQILMRDPAHSYGSMQERSQEYYREAIVRVAERAGVHEAEIARSTVRLAEKAASRGTVTRSAEMHVGYYLIDKGRSDLEREVGYAPTFRDRVLKKVLGNSEEFYFGTLLGLSLIFTALMWAAIDPWMAPLSVRVFVGISSLFLAFEVAINVLNTVITRFLPLRRLPRLDFSEGIFDDARTVVVIPSMLRSVESIRELVKKLEVRYLGNKDPNLYFALLMDFKDAKTAEAETDFSLIATIDDEVAILNKKYCPHSPRFFFFYRERKWNPKEAIFMGWERKRGKLREWNELVLGKKGTTFLNEKHAYNLPKFRYVITLDEDTELPKDAARRLIGAIHHPLNRPILVRDRVIRGFGIVQPRVSVRIKTATKSLFTRLFSATSGIDSYSSPVSDVYQDLFGSSIFFGKGVYDIEAVEKTMEGKIPDNAVLSHDLLEGNYARVGFAGDVILFDGFPSFYHEFMVRLERWIRGDWQIIGWLLPQFLHRRAKTATSGWSLIDRFKLFDNLRRSLVPVFATLFVGGALLAGIDVGTVGLLVLVALAAPYLSALGNDILSLKQVPFSIRFLDTLRQIVSAAAHTSLRAILLLHQAYVSFHAILVTVFRVFVSDKHLLRWQNAADVGLKLKGRLFEYYRSMWVTQMVPLLLFAFVYTGHLDGAITPWLSLWFFSPALAYIVSNAKKEEKEIEKHDERFLRRIAYRTARFFLDLSRVDNNWLIEDHLQEAPKKTSRGRPATSPTNIGMFLLSLLSARDFGYVSLDEMSSRIGKALTSMRKLERFKGHFYNWYDIEKLETLSPKYISSVDSSNLVVSLITLSQGLREMKDEVVVSLKDLAGIEDAAEVLLEEAEVVLKGLGGSSSARRSAKSLTVVIRRLLGKISAEKNPASIRVFYDLLLSIHSDAAQAERAVSDLAVGDYVPDEAPLVHFVKKLASTIEDKLASLLRSVPHAVIDDPSIKSYVFRDERLFAAYEELLDALEEIPSFSGYGEYAQRIKSINLGAIAQSSSLDARALEHVSLWYEKFLKELARGEAHVAKLLKEIDTSISLSDMFSEEADFSFLYDEEKGLFHIGYNTAFEKVDKACYNLLASEANLLSLVSIVKDQAPQKHWFYLGRKLVRAGSNVGLVSWGGSLFEYLTSLVFLNVHTESLIGGAAGAAVREHVRYARERRVMWGMGESAYLSLDAAKGYEYQVFGSPRLGLKRGLADYLVVAPYVSALSLHVNRDLATKNLRLLASRGARGQFGFYDAVDYMDESRTRARHPIPARIYYAHHQGFLLASIANTLFNNSVRRRFHSDMRVKSTEILLEERMPDVPAALPLSPTARLPLSDASSREDSTHAISYIPQKSAYPRYSFISNGEYSVAVSNSGAGWSSKSGVSLTKKKLDPVIDDVGSFIYIKDLNKNVIWSPTLRPAGAGVKNRKVVFHENKAFFAGSYGSMTATISVALSGDNVESRVLELSNDGKDDARVLVATFSEVSLAYPHAENLHPHFQHMLVDAEKTKDGRGLCFSRPHPNDRLKRIFFAHWIGRAGFRDDLPRLYSSREEFFGRYGSISSPRVLTHNDGHVHKNGYPLDPASAIVKEVKIKPGEKKRISFGYATADSKETLEKNIQKYRTERSLHSISESADKESLRMTRELGISQTLALDFQALASKMISGKDFVGGEVFPESNLPYIHSLWRLGISGDYPLMVAIVKDIEDVQAIKHMLIAHTYLKSKSIEIDLVILNEEPSSYIKVLDDEVDFLIRQSRSNRGQETGGSVFHIKSELVSASDKQVLLFVARSVLTPKDKSIKQQIAEALKTIPKKSLPKIELISPRTTKAKNVEMPPLHIGNGVGGYVKGADEYAFIVSKSKPTPSPWTHIIANEHLGTVVSETGSMWTWAIDSFDNRITAMKNDTLRIEHPEAFFVRDDETGESWSPTPFPKPPGGDALVRYGKGKASFETQASEIKQNFSVSLAKDAPVKFVTLSLKNQSRRKRTLSIFAYFEVTLDAGQHQPKCDVEISRDDSGFVYATNRMRNLLPLHTAVFGVPGYDAVVTADRSEFIGRNGSIENPAALTRTSLSGDLMSSDPCLAFHVSIVLLPGEEKEIPFVIGFGKNKESAKDLVHPYTEQRIRLVEQSKANEYWKEVTSRIQIETPDEALNILVSNILVYQTLVSRIFAKTGFFQPSGAIGFRDQLQDATALIWWDEAFTKEFMHKGASHQFVEGDALCWWHDHNGFGLRLVLSDHALWLVRAALEYSKFSGDVNFWNTEIPFLEGPRMSFAYEKEWTGTPTQSKEVGSIYEHCARALEKSLVFGERGLPLIGMSDWNDGLSKTGTQGKGESVWLAFFLIYLLRGLLLVAQSRGDALRVELFAKSITSLERSIEREAWDGKWYRRAFLDSGLPIGSRRVKEFRIDSLAQSWSVISGVAPEDKADRAVRSALSELLQDNLMRLIAPPLQTSSFDPGYIKDYPPGVRENGSQYNHAALWMAEALFIRGDADGGKAILDMVNPFTRTKTESDVKRYRGEPYAVASDVYGSPAPHGRAGWTWYTGAAGVFLKVVLEKMFGVIVSGEVVTFSPKLPTSWTEAKFTWKRDTSSYVFVFKREGPFGNQVIKTTLDGVGVKGPVPLKKDGKNHILEIYVGGKVS